MSREEKIILWAVCSCLLYVVVALNVFAWRHPHLTDKECFMYIDLAIRFERVPE